MRWRQRRRICRAMGWKLAPHVSFATASGRTVFLDLCHDRYFMLSYPQSEAFLAWLEAPDPEAGLVRSLALAGLLVRTDAPAAIAPPMILRPRRSLSGPAHVPGIATMLNVGRSTLRARGMLRRRGLLATLDLLRPVSAQTGAGEAARHSLTFQSVRHHFPARGTCLPDSLALLDFLQRRGVEASIVFGIIGAPFQAHCWVQLGDEVLNDALDHVAPFTPILQR